MCDVSGARSRQRSCRQDQKLSGAQGRRSAKARVRGAPREQRSPSWSEPGANSQAVKASGVPEAQRSQHEITMCSSIFFGAQVLSLKQRLRQQHVANLRLRSSIHGQMRTSRLVQRCLGLGVLAAGQARSSHPWWSVQWTSPGARPLPGEPGVGAGDVVHGLIR